MMPPHPCHFLPRLGEREEQPVMEALARTRPHEKEPRGSRRCRAGGQGDAGRRSGATGAGARGSGAATARPAWVTGRGSPARSATSHLPPHGLTQPPRPRPGCSASRRGPEAGSGPPPRIRGAQGGSPRPVTSVTSGRSTGFSLCDSAAQPAAWQRRDTFQTLTKCDVSRFHVCFQAHPIFAGCLWLLHH